MTAIELNVPMVILKKQTSKILDDNFYQLAPYETITKEQYEAMAKEQPVFSANILARFERFEEEFDIGADCEGGACPVR